MSNNDSGGGGDSPSKVVRGLDGKVKTVDGVTATERVFQLIQDARYGLTTDEMMQDVTLQHFGQSTVSTVPSRLRDLGLIEPLGKRGRFTVWYAVEEPEHVPVNPKLRRKAERVLSMLHDPEVLTEMWKVIDTEKTRRLLHRQLRLADKADEEARLWQEKQQKEDEKEALRLADMRLATVDKNLRYWERLRKSFDAASEVLGLLFKEIHHFPPLMMAEVKMLDRSIEELEQQIHYFKVRIHSAPPPATLGETVIDV